jgi:hypothetical protein
MASADETQSAAPDPDVTPSRGRVRGMFARSRELARIVYRDPEHVSERLTLYTVGRLADASLEWAQSVRSTRADTAPAEIAEELRIQTAQIARIDGATSGTPFSIALAARRRDQGHDKRAVLRAVVLFGSVAIPPDSLRWSTTTARPSALTGSSRSAHWSPCHSRSRPRSSHAAGKPTTARRGALLLGSSVAGGYLVVTGLAGLPSQLQRRRPHPVRRHPIIVARLIPPSALIARRQPRIELA